MDALTTLLDGPRAHGAFLLRTVFEPPWSVRVADQAPLSLVAGRAGTAWVWRDGGEPVAVRPGDVALLRGPEPYTFADTPGTAPQVIIHPGQRCTDPDGRELSAAMDLGVRTWGNCPRGTTVLLVGTYRMPGTASRRLLDALPPILLTGQAPPAVALLDEEIDQDRPGQEVVLDRMLDLLLVDVLRRSITTPGPVRAGWHRGLGDPVVGQALRLMHDDPARRWTVAGLAAATGVSRATLARRFADLVGESPMAYLTAWRLALAADLLREPSVTVAAVARRVGYSSPFALSVAYKRIHGAAPRAVR